MSRADRFCPAAPEAQEPPVTFRSKPELSSPRSTVELKATGLLRTSAAAFLSRVPALAHVSAASIHPSMAGCWMDGPSGGENPLPAEPKRLDQQLPAKTEDKVMRFFSSKRERMKGRSCRPEPPGGIQEHWHRLDQSAASFVCPGQFGPINMILSFLMKDVNKQVLMTN